MWRDLERICEKEGMQLKLPPFLFPQNSLKSSRVALVGERDGWIAEFSRAVYVANFAGQKDISDDATLGEILARLGLDPAKVLADANTQDNKDRLKKQTEEAAALGVFGAPSCTVGAELFWGNDRLEDAINFATNPARILADELQKTDPALVERMNPWLVRSPKFATRSWDYRPAHEVPVYYACWVVLEHPKSNTGIAYCPRGFGPERPWGLIWLGSDQEGLGMGQDSAWFRTLADAFLDSFAAQPD